MRCYVLLFLAVNACAQPQFTTATFKSPTPVSAKTPPVAQVLEPGHIIFRSLSIGGLIRRGYEIAPAQIDAPASVWQSSFDIDATYPADAPTETIRLMIQSLLFDRFGLRIHWDRREIPVYALVVTKKGPKMQEWVQPVGAARRKPSRFQCPSASEPRITANDTLLMETRACIGGDAMTMPQLVDALSRFLDRPVADMTQLKGQYGLKLIFEPVDPEVLALAVPVGRTIGMLPPSRALFGAVQGLGLKLESRRLMANVLVVDQCSSSPVAK